MDKLKIGDKVKWNDPAIEEYGEEMEVAKERKFTILEINEDIVLCSDGVTEVECYYNELEKF